MQIASYSLANNLILAPMAGISDRPFRELCKEFGASLAVSEMAAANPALRLHEKTLLKTNHDGEPGLKSVQIVGTDPEQLANFARFNAERGAQLIDINMGCPAKKVCSVAAGSALLRDETLVKKILDTVVKAVDIPVTLKIRTGWDTTNRNAISIAQLAEQAGISALTIHGRTRACKFEGKAEYDTIKTVKQSVSIPIIANGDIDSPEKAVQVLQQTQADGLMIGRAAQGNPWLFGQIDHFMRHGEHLKKPSLLSVQHVMTTHLEKLYSFYGNILGVKIARKHIGWYFNQLAKQEQTAISPSTKQTINQAQTPSDQMMLIAMVFNHLTNESAA